MQGFDAAERELDLRKSIKADEGKTVMCSCPNCIERVPCTVLKGAMRWQNMLVSCDVCGREFRRCEQVHPERRLDPEEKRRRRREADAARLREKRKDPDWRAKRNASARKWWANLDPERKEAYLAKDREYQKGYRKDHPEKWAYVPASELTPDQLAERRNKENARHKKYAESHPGYYSEKAKRYRERHPEHREKARLAYHETMAFLEKRPAALARFKARQKAYCAEYHARKKAEKEVADGLGSS